jgi:hypothetical protein
MAGRAPECSLIYGNIKAPCTLATPLGNNFSESLKKIDQTFFKQQVRFDRGLPVGFPKTGHM